MAMAPKKLFLRIEADQFHHDDMHIADLDAVDDDDDGVWTLVVTPNDLEKFIRDACQEGFFNFHVFTEDDPRAANIKETVTRADLENVTRDVTNLRNSLHNALADINRSLDAISQALEFKDLEMKYPKRESLQLRQDAEVLLRKAKENVEPFPVRTKPLRPGEEPTPIHLRPSDASHHRDPKIQSIIENASDIAKSPEVQAEREARVALQKSTLEEREAEAERIVDETLMSLGTCAICGSKDLPASAPLCSTCSNKLYKKPHPSAHLEVSENRPITFGQAKELREWLDKPAIVDFPEGDIGKGMPF
jgi:hypothetical protein